MSIITWVKTAEGFVIGSDGRNSDSDTQSILSEDARKIFPAEFPHVRLAYALGHTVRFGLSPETIMFDFAIEAPRALGLVAKKRRSDWRVYLRALATSLSDALDEARKAAGAALDKPTETYVFVGGYFEKRFHTGHLWFQHGIETSNVESVAHPAGFSAPPFGSTKVLDLLQGDDSRFTEFSQPKRSDVYSLAEGIKRVENDIRAHCHPVAMTVDPDRCRGIGGRIQIATVTFGGGFRWVSGFEPAVTR